MEKYIDIRMIEVMWLHDWDCEPDSDYWEHPLVRECFKGLKPGWFEEDYDG